MTEKEMQLTLGKHFGIQYICGGMSLNSLKRREKLTLE